VTVSTNKERAMTDELGSSTEASGAGRASPTRKRFCDSGMTLMEIMIVFALIALIMGAVGVGAFNYFKKGQVKTARIQVNEIMQKAQQYMMDNNNECPKTMDDLVAQKYMPRRQKDPWNKDFIMRCPGQINTDGIDVISVGPDGTEGTADDIKAQE
jgi:general secretion pathway protein G